MKNLSSFLLQFFAVISSVWAVNGLIPIDSKEIQLADGRRVLAKRSGQNSHKIILKKRTKIIWEHEYEQEYDRLWDFTFFVPIKEDKYSTDLNKDGFPEIAIGTWDGGNNMANRTVLIFTVKADSLEYYATEKFNLEYGKYVYPSKGPD